MERAKEWAENKIREKFGGDEKLNLCRGYWVGELATAFRAGEANGIARETKKETRMVGESFRRHY